MCGRVALKVRADGSVLSAYTAITPCSCGNHVGIHRQCPWAVSVKAFDYVEICTESAEKHPKSAIQVRNKHIVDRSDFIVFWIERESGGAYRTMQYAKKYGKEMINLAVQAE